MRKLLKLNLDLGVIGFGLYGMRKSKKEEDFGMYMLNLLIVFLGIYFFFDNMTRRKS